MKSVPALPEPDPVLVDSLARFDGVDTIAGMRKIISETSPIPRGTKFDRETHFNADWAQSALHSM